MNIIKTFVSIDKNHSFTMEIIETTCYFRIEMLEPKKYKTFLLLLKKGFEFMIENNIKYVKLKINKEDKNNFRRCTFIEEEDITIVKISIDDFLIEILWDGSEAE